MHELEKVLCCCEDEVSRCDHERRAVADEDAFVRKEDTTLCQTKRQCLKNVSCRNLKKIVALTCPSATTVFASAENAGNL
jgi:hypothetical protein